MSLFIDISEFFKKYQILILGSYHPNNFQTLIDLKQKLINKGFTQTYLAKDLIKGDLESSDSARLSIIFSRIKDAMIESEFNVFLFFSEPQKENESTIVELLTLVQSAYFSSKIDRTLVLFPSSYSSSMLEGFVTTNQLNVYFYDNREQIFQRCFVFIKQNLMNYF